jgi:type III secretion protein K
VLGQLLRQRDGLGLHGDYSFDSRVKRLMLMEGAALRTLAALLGFGVHAAALRERGFLSRQLRRQARRYGDEVDDFFERRVPLLTEIRMNPAPLQRRPVAAGRVAVDRGYRLLQALLAAQGDDALERTRRKLPWRTSCLRLPQLTPLQLAQVEELALNCIVPERLPAWDWLF